MKIGIPGELIEGELRVGATPKTVKRLIKQGFDVTIEKGAGKMANFIDDSYKEAGAAIADSAMEIYADNDIILKVQAVTDSEIEMMHEGQVTFKLSLPCSES